MKRRILVDLDEETIGVLDSLAEERRAPRARVLREAVAEYLVRHAGVPPAAPKPLEGFGALKGVFDGGDGFDYQERLRAEWD
jgi:hypothetical protein